MKLRWLLFGLLIGFCAQAWAQDPVYFKADAEAGLPSNEVYNVMEDQDGLIWLGTDAGLYKFNGAQSQLYFSPSQKSRSITGLTLAPSGRIYAFNFHGQLFYVEKDSLIELPSPYGPVTNLSYSAQKGLVICHLNSLSIYSEATGKWLREDSLPHHPRKVLMSPRIAEDGQIWFMEDEGINHWEGGQKAHVEVPCMVNSSPGLHMLETYGNEVWVFNKNEAEVFRYSKGKLIKHQDQALVNQLRGRKITNVRTLKDGHLWICTYSGIIRYHPPSRAIQTFFPEYSFSELLIDRQGSYWFASLGHGLFRVPDLEFLAWPTGNESLLNLAHDNQSIHAASKTGDIFQLDVRSRQMTKIPAHIQADIQAMDFDPELEAIRICINQKHFFLRNGGFDLTTDMLPPHKAYCRLSASELVACSSLGCYLFEQDVDGPSLKLSEDWCREAIPGPDQHSFWVASNNGLILFGKTDGIWKEEGRWLKGLQVLSIQKDASEQVFALTFDGKIYVMEKSKSPRILAALPIEILPRDMAFADNRLLLATSRGLRCLELGSNTWKILRRGSGLLSENIQQVAVFKGRIWMTSDKGLQSLPLDFDLEHPGPNIFLRTIKVDGELRLLGEELQLGYRQHLRLGLEASDYRSEGAFFYSYRVSSLDSTWIKIPADPGTIDLYNLPPGRFEIELRGLDYLGRSSPSIRLKGFIASPFWQTWWFILLCIALAALATWSVFKLRINVLKRKQLQEIKKLKLENQLTLSQETALKAQMNPHFIFNVLNSIKGYIYENDRKQAVSYLNNFSDLIRNTLEMSSKPWVSLEEELKALKTYIDLEGMLLDQELSSEIAVDAAIDLEGTMIPSLIIQPFVENSFKHGLRHRKGKVWLRIGISKAQDGMLRIEITDNGIGREAAAKLNALNQHKPASFASMANERRINLLNRKEKGIVGLEIQDNFDAQGASSGTTVILKIRCNE